MLAGNRDDLVLPFHVAGFGKPGRNQHGAGNALLADFFKRLGHELGRDGKHGHIDVARHIEHALVGRHAHDLFGLRVDRVDLALVAAVDQVLHHRIADLAVLGRCADHRHRVRAHDAVHLLDDLFLRGTVLLRLRREVHHNPHVGGDGAVLAGEHRVQVQLGNLRKIGDQLRHALDHAGQRLAVGRVGAAHALEHLGGGNAVQHRQRILIGGRRHAEGDVLEHFHQHAAQAEGHQLAERRVGHGADDDFLAARDHLLHLHADDFGIGVVLPGVLDDGAVALLHIRRRLQAHQHAASLRLVQDVRRDDLHHHREAHLRRQFHRVRRRLGHALARHRDAIGVADQLALGRRQRSAPLLLHGRQNLAYRILVMCHVRSPSVQALQTCIREVARLRPRRPPSTPRSGPASGRASRGFPRCARPAAANAPLPPARPRA
ncbi:hypothetical protein D3C81_1157460 [compost metagenome]